MLPMISVWGVALDLGLVLLLTYVILLWVGGWALEYLARAHFRRAQRAGHIGFSYDAELDRYECPQKQLLTLHTIDSRGKLAVYKAPASSCSECTLKALCAPHDEGRRIYRSLAEFHETDVGRFHRCLSLIVLGLALAFSTAGLLAWWNKPGEWLLVIASFVSIGLFWLDARDFQDGQRRDESMQGATGPW
jgi:hypothetical protein